MTYKYLLKDRETSKNVCGCEKDGSTCWLNTRWAKDEIVPVDDRWATRNRILVCPDGHVTLISFGIDTTLD